MTRVFTENGDSIPVTVIRILPNYITQIKTKENDGYNAIQVTTGKVKASRLTQPKAGQFKKANVDAGRCLLEFRKTEKPVEEYKLGDALDLNAFTPAQKVDVTGTSKGRGFAGVIKRWGFSAQRASHGNSLSHRAPGSIGQCQTPGRVFKGKKMAGHMGNKQVTVQGLEIVKIDEKRQLLLVKGAIPGCPGSNVIVKTSVKSTHQVA